MPPPHLTLDNFTIPNEVMIMIVMIIIVIIIVLMIMIMIIIIMPPLPSHSGQLHYF